jgi:hypothetical protein
LSTTLNGFSTQRKSPSSALVSCRLSSRSRPKSKLTSPKYNTFPSFHPVRSAREFSCI